MHIMSSTPFHTEEEAAAPLLNGLSASQHNRSIRSFVLRQGHFSKAQARGIEVFYPIFGIPYQNKLIDWDQAFQRTAPTVLEIGFGMGTATAEIANLCQNTNFIGVEVHGPGVGALLNLIDAQQLQNLRIVQHDAVEVLRDMIAENSLAGAHIFFPDPWHKSRHHKRRLIQPNFIRQLVSRIQTGGYLHIATDWQDYAEHILAVLQAEPSLQNTVLDYAPRPDYRPLTKFEQRGIKLGHGVWDMIFTKKSS
jgi:tRNA (guanine-N7-)-methyltransferase